MVKQLAERRGSPAVLGNGHSRARRSTVRVGAVLLPALLFALLLALYAQPAGAATLTVCPAGGQYAAIQEAVNAANAGDTIVICAGTYAESIDLTKMGSSGGSQGNITLVASGVVTVAPAGGSAIYLSDNFAGDIQLGNLHTTSPDSNAIDFSYTIDGALIISGGGAANAGGGGLSAWQVTGGVTIDNASFVDNTWQGVAVAATPVTLQA